MLNENNKVKALKSGIWYLVSNFTTKAIGFLTIPIFTRLLLREEFGLYSNYISWLNTFNIFVTLNLTSTFISARFDFKKDFDGYISSVLALSALSTLFWTFLVSVTPDWFSNITGVKKQYLFIMMIYLFFTSAIEMFQTRERYYFRYKIVSLISVILAVSSSVLSIALVFYMNDRLEGRIIGVAIPYIVVGFLLFILIFSRGKKININYWKYALPICIPFIPHLLSLTLLNSMDKIMITRYCGSEFNALYSLAYSCGSIISLLMVSMNAAFAPWLGEQLDNKNFVEIRNVATKYICVFVYLTCGFMLLAPEILLVMGGKNYLEALQVILPISIGCVFQLIYTMYVNVEQFKKKTLGMALGTVLAAIINYSLNYIFIPSSGYVAAAYTSLISFFCLMIFHIFLVYKMGFGNVYDLKIIVLIAVLINLYAILVNFMYPYILIRYIVIVIYCFTSLLLFLKIKRSLHIS